VTAPDDLTAALEQIRARSAAALEFPHSGFAEDSIQACTLSAQDVPTLLAAVEAVLALADSANAKGTTLCDCPACITGRNNGFTGIHRPRSYMWDLDPAKIREAISSRLATGAAPATERTQR
jgi:hypothetical protein